MQQQTQVSLGDGRGSYLSSGYSFRGQFNFKQLGLSSLKILINGSICCVAKTIVAPLERVRLLDQLLSLLPLVYNRQALLVKDHISALSLAKLIIREEGFFSLWKGNGFGCISILPALIVKELISPYIRVLIVRHDPKQDYFKYLMEELLEEGISTTIRLLLSHPFNVLQIRKQADISFNNPHSAVADFLTMFRVSGMYGLYRCLPLAILSALIQKAAFIILTEFFRRGFLSNPVLKQTESTSWENWFISHICTHLSWVLTYPLDTVAKGSIVLNIPIRRSYQKIMAQSGFQRLFNGLGSHLIAGTLFSFALVGLYHIKWRLMDIRERRRSYRLLQETH